MCSVQIVWKGNEAMQYLESLGVEMVWLAAQDLMRKSNADVPVDTGTLKRSGVVTLDKLPNGAQVYAHAQEGGTFVDPSVLDATRAPLARNPRQPIAFASYNTPYAVEVHEGLGRKGVTLVQTASGKKHFKLNVSRPKFMERNVAYVAKRWKHYLARAIRRVGGVNV